jgi:hypothetical protein
VRLPEDTRHCEASTNELNCFAPPFGGLPVRFHSQQALISARLFLSGDKTAMILTGCSDVNRATSDLLLKD